MSPRPHEPAVNAHQRQRDDEADAEEGQQVEELAVAVHGGECSRRRGAVQRASGPGLVVPMATAPRLLHPTTPAGGVFRGRLV
jgi:hypothetical protein